MPQTDSPLPVLDPRKAQFIEQIALYYESYGIPRIAGRMFGLLIVTPEALSAEQMSQQLNASLSSISTNMKALIANGWVEKVSIPGDRTTYYRFSSSAWESVMERRRQSFVPLKAIASNLNAALDKDDPARARLDEMTAWADLLMSHYDALIAAWRDRTTIGSED